jgi:hypothetical protein
MSPIDADLAEVLEHYPAVLRGRAQPHTEANAFSGARLWRLETGAGPCCVRAWPRDGTTPEQLRFIHRLLQRAAALDFVPRLIATRHGDTWLHLRQRYWEMTTWLPGRADFLACPSTARLEATCTALAQLHLAWAAVEPDVSACPAVLRRLDALERWQCLVQQGWQPAWQEDDPITPWARRAWLQVQARWAEVPRRLAPWRGRLMPVQPCLCDLWHAHVLYRGDAVTGLIDYGSAKIDHIAVDLARLLGSLISGDTTLRQAGLDAYARLRPLADWERALVADLDATGTVIALMNWLRWLYDEDRVFANRAAVAARLAALLQ